VVAEPPEIGWFFLCSEYVIMSFITCRLYLSLGSLFEGRDAFLAELHKSRSRGTGRVAIVGSATCYDKRANTFLTGLLLVCVILWLY
jgi:hypothetical protein